MGEVKSREWNLSVGDPQRFDLGEMLNNDYNDMSEKLHRVGRSSRSHHADGGSVMQMDTMPEWAQSGSGMANGSTNAMNMKKQGGMIFNVQGADPHNVKNMLKRSSGGDVSKIDDDRGLEGYILGK